MTRVKSVPGRRIESVGRSGVGLSDVFAVFAVNDDITKSPGFDSPSGDMRLIPDLGSLVLLPDAPGWAWAPADQYDQDLQPMPTCQRTTLKRTVERARERGLDLQMTYEVEFTLFRHDGQPLHEGPSYSPRAYLPLQEFALELVEALEAMGIEVEQLHPEYAFGQYEISVGPRAPVEAADQHVLLRLTIMRIAYRHGLTPSFAPVAIPGLVGNGCHLHYSLWRDGRNLMAGGERHEGLTDEAAAFTAGILGHLRELMAVYAPSTMSYVRLVPHHWSGAYTCWGRENREAALRFVRGTVGTVERSANIELKVVDGSSNPYLAAACLIGSGLAGLDEARDLPEPLTEDPADVTAERAEELGIQRLPADLAEAIEGFERSPVAADILGGPLHQAFAAVRRFEWDLFGDADPAAVAEQLRWRYG
ncbi:MAG: glutamine synthetase family protein [Actinobacteria bacterium]|nr:glutamine synthetase family protein [Actinomycetota bacterium]